MSRAPLAAALLLAACGAPSPVVAVDGGADAGPLDSGAPDSGAQDAGAIDAGPLDAGPVDGGPADGGVPQVLLFTRTEGYRHDSIEAGVAMFEALGAARGIHFEHTEEATAFTAANLSRFGAVIWLQTTGDVLDDPQQAAFEAYLEGGGGYVGVHAAADCEYGWPWYGRMLGAWFERHPEIQEASFQTLDGAHPATAHLPATFRRTDELYDFQQLAPTGLNFLLSVDEASYRGGGMGAFHPLAWSREFAQGRVFYSAVGHTQETYAEPAMREHLWGGLSWVLRR